MPALSHDTINGHVTIIEPFELLFQVLLWARTTMAPRADEDVTRAVVMVRTPCRHSLYTPTPIMHS